MKKCGLVGREIYHSMSPQIHNEYFLKHGIPLKYEIFDLNNLEELEVFTKDARSNGIIGFNVTIPYKIKIIEYLDELAYPANFIGAVNTVLVDKNKLIGFNTDYFGFIESLKSNKIDVKPMNILIIGNGDSAKAVYTALIDLKVKHVDIAGRSIKSIEKDFILARNIISLGKDINVSQYDMIINCTPLGNMNNNILPINLRGHNKDLIIYDLNYNPSKSQLLLLGEEYGLKVINGESMLMSQTLGAIEIWKSRV